MRKTGILIIAILLAACHRPPFSAYPVSARQVDETESTVFQQQEAKQTTQTVVAAAGTAENLDLSGIETHKAQQLPSAASLGKSDYPQNSHSGIKTVPGTASKAKPTDKVKALWQARKVLRQREDTPSGSKTNSLAIISLVLALISLPLLFVPAIGFIALLTMIGAIVTGAIAKKQIKKSDGTQKGKGFALAGFILGIVETSIVLLVTIIFILILISWGGIA